MMVVFEDRDADTSGRITLFMALKDWSYRWMATLVLVGAARTEFDCRSGRAQRRDYVLPATWPASRALLKKGVDLLA